MELDLRMVLSVAISALLMAVVFHFQARSFPINIKGIQRWSWGFLLLCCAALLASLRDVAPAMVSLWLGTVFLQAALSVLYLGLAQFQERKPRWWLMAVPMGLSTVSLAVVLFLGSPLWMRFAILSISNLLLVAPCLVLVLQGRLGEPQWRFSKLFTGIFLGILMLVALYRSCWALVYQPTMQPTTPVGMHQLLSILIPSLIVALSTGLALMAFDRLKDELEYLVSHDALTGVFARRGFLELAQSEISRALRSHRHTALLMLDLDHFKQVNDRYGHPAGDLVLCKFVDIAKTCLRREDFVGRFGGEEFMVLLPDTNPAAARVVAERIRTAVSASRITVAKDSIRFTVSIGIANANGTDKGSLDELLKLADGAMYLAKSRGRNRVEVAGQ